MHVDAWPAEGRTPRPRVKAVRRKITGRQSGTAKVLENYLRRYLKEARGSSERMGLKARRKRPEKLRE